MLKFKYFLLLEEAHGGFFIIIRNDVTVCQSKMPLFRIQNVGKGDSMLLPGQRYLNIDFACKWKTADKSRLLNSDFLRIGPICGNINGYTSKTYTDYFFLHQYYLQLRVTTLSRPGCIGIRNVFWH